MNCLTYALRKYFKEGGYVMMRRSRLASDFNIKNKWHPANWVPHFLHRDRSHNITQYTPTNTHREEAQKRGLLWAYLQLWNFSGTVTGDDKMEDTEQIKDVVLKPDDVISDLNPAEEENQECQSS